MADINYTFEHICKDSDRFRVCKNSRSFDCKKKEFMAKDRRVIFCTKKCGDSYHNKIKLDTKQGKLKGIDANIKILHAITCKDNAITIDSTILDSIQFDFKIYDKKINLEKGNFILKFGVFNVQRVGEKEILIYK